jgi:hypothetical protein
VPYITALAFLLLIVLTAGRYGYFGDELYYIACSKHLDWGYVDHPPLVAVFAFINRKLFGETLSGLRLLSGLAGAGTVLLTALITRALGGTRFAQSFAALLILFSAGFPALHSFFSMNPFDIFLCSLFIFVFIGITDDPVPKRWILLGVMSGIGLLNKYTLLILGFSLLLALILSRRWSYLKTPWTYMACMTGFLIFLPHLLWQTHHDWPTLEFIENATTNKNLSLSPFAFFLQLVLGLNPCTVVIWGSGVIHLMFSKSMKKYRVLGWMAVLFFAIYMMQNSKVYYVLPIFPLLFASGACAIEGFIRKFRIEWLKRVAVISIILSGSVLMPLFVPVLPVEKFVSYAKTLRIWDHLKMEKGESDTLPLHFIYRFGWPEMVELVAEIYHSLHDEEKTDCAILASWYGPAGAIDHFGGRYDLPSAICGRNSYWLWGPRDYTGECIISVGFETEQLKQVYNQVSVAAQFTHPYAYDMTICICRNPKLDMKSLWSMIKVYN